MPLITLIKIENEIDNSTRHGERPFTRGGQKSKASMEK
jgi:hypothetical protein